MNVVAIELGDRPLILTKSRRFAPAGAKLLAETLEHFRFAEDGIIILDWSNQTGMQPDEVAKPVLVVRTGRYVPEAGNRYLTVEVRLDVEELFGKDEIIADDFINIIKSMEDKMMSTIERAKDN